MESTISDNETVMVDASEKNYVTATFTFRGRRSLAGRAGSNALE